MLTCVTDHADCTEPSRPHFFCRSFFWALLQANSCARQLRGFCFPGSALKTLGSLPESSRSLWEQKPSLFGCSKKMGQKKEIQKCLTRMLSGIGLARGSSDVAASCVPPDVDLLTGASRNVGLRRRRRSD